MQLPVTDRRLTWIVVAIWVLAGLAGCGEKSEPGAQTPLLRIGNHVVTERDFEAAFEKARSWYPPDLNEDPAAYQEARLQLLNELVEEGVLLERARVLDLVVTNEEIEAMVTDIKADFPDQQFEQLLLENAVSYADWKAGLARKLLIEKTITRELGAGIRIAPSVSPRILTEAPAGDTATVPEKPASAPSVTPETSRGKAMEAKYLDWIRQQQDNFRIEINWELWEKMAG